MPKKPIETWDTPEDAQAAKQNYQEAAEKAGHSDLVYYVRPLRMSNSVFPVYGVYRSDINEPDARPRYNQRQPRHAYRRGRIPLPTPEEAQAAVDELAEKYGYDCAFWVEVRNHRALWHAELPGYPGFITSPTVEDLEDAVQHRIS